MPIRSNYAFLASKDSKIIDSKKLWFGTGAGIRANDGDISFAWDGTDFDILQATTNSSIKLGVSGAGIDLQLYGDTVAADLLWDQSADSLIFGDSGKLVFGTGSDLTFAWDGTDFDVTQATTNSSIKWGVSGAGIDHVFYGDTATADMTWDQSADTLLFNDNAKVVFGTGSDITMRWDATDFDILQAGTNSAISWGVDGAGMDHHWYTDTASAKIWIDQSADELRLIGGATLAEYSVRTITAAGATAVTVDQSGAYFYATAAATFTLPTVATGGQIYHFVNLTAANMAITSLTDAIVYKNDTFTTVTFQTTNEQIGAAATVFSNGTNWYLLDHCPPSYAVGGTGS